MVKQYIKYEINGESVYVEAASIPSEIDDEISHGDDGLIEGGKFETALNGLKPIANAVMETLNDLNNPSEISLEMGVKFGAKTGVILASADTEATMKITLKWHKNPDYE